MGEFIIGLSQSYEGGKNMIDEAKWNRASDEQKMTAIKVIRALMTENSVTKADNRLMTDYLIKKCESEEQ